MNAAITALLAALSALAPGATTTTITTIINALVTAIPAVIEWVSEALPLVKNIIAALKSNDQITDDQMAQLETLEQQYDADFEAAATAAQKEDSSS